LTLKLPFEGHEQVKEYILDGGRPQLTSKELLYPSNIIDLMIVCWSQHSADRPSSSQLVSITTAPEFAHMLDVVSLNSSDAAIVAGEAFMIDDFVTCDDSSSMGNQLDGETWLSRADGLVSILSCNQNGWLDYKNVVLNEESFVTSLCLVEDTIWMGELTGLVHIFCVKTYAEIGNFSMAPYVLPNDKSPRHQCSLRPVEMIHLPALKGVLICINRPGSVLLCTISQALSGNTFDMASCIKSPQELGAISCCAAVLLRDMSYAVWCGHTAGYISMFNLENSSFKSSGSVNHYDPVIEGVEVSRLVSSPNNGRYVWSYIYPGCVLYQWDVNQRSIISKLDCSKIAPCSESINTLNIEERLNPGHCQVTSLTLVEKEECTQLYVGTTWGVLIVTEADQLKPITAFRPHLDEIRVIVPINQQKRVNPFSIGRFSSSTNRNVGPSSTTSANDEKSLKKSSQK
uniref:LRRK2 beta-propeller domain-containing protein n=1 Tax=Romanomermis culicivorax TaxID=13658 RepID=A0A915IK65_ROMCU